MTTNIFLDKILRVYCENTSLGCFSCDTIPNVHTARGQSFIFNLSPKNESGSHFVAVVINKRGDKSLYFDSYGTPLYTKEALDRLSSTKVFFAGQRIQANESISCGYFALAVCLCHRLKIPFARLYKKYSLDKLENNDKIVGDFIVDCLKKISISSNIKISENDLREISRYI
mgnify:CR=1 FL=1